eukprot:GILJ01009129.1.p1 GENE.GILJ01009129.1~~GILJ01009129.1.p1  ORF type:complete len:469 (+),score=62.11 GILJ01009129.1:200-1606(+)
MSTSLTLSARVACALLLVVCLLALQPCNGQSLRSFQGLPALSTRRLAGQYINNTCPQDDNSVTSNFRKWIPRRDFNGRPVGCAFEPYDDSYRASIFVLGIPGLSFAVLALASGIAFFSIYFCCTQCQKRSRSSYSSRSIVALVALLLAAVLTVSAGLIYGFVENSKADSGTVDAANGLRSVPVQMRALIQPIYTDLVDLYNREVFSQNPVPYFNMVFGTIDRLGNSTSSASSDLKTYERVRSAMFITMYTIVLVCAVVLFVAMFWKSFGILLTFIGLTFLSLVLTWFLFALHLPTSAGLVDLCYSMDLYNNAYQTENTDGIENNFIAQYIACPDVTQPALYVQSIGTNKLSELNRNLAPYGTVVTAANVSSVVNNTVYPTAIRNAAADVTVLVRTSTSLALIQQCTPFLNILTSISDPLCGQAKPAVNKILGSLLIVGISLILALLFAILIGKPFSSRNPVPLSTQPS